MGLKIISVRNISGHYSMAVSNDAEEACAEAAGVKLKTPNFHFRRYVFRTNRVSRTIVNKFPRFGENLLFDVRGDAVLFLMGIDLMLNGFLASVECRKWVYLYDSPQSIWGFLEKKFHTWRNIGCLYLSSSQAAEHFKGRLDFPVRWLPQASTYRYVPLSNQLGTESRRRIILNIGRPNRALNDFFDWFSKRHSYKFITQKTTQGILFAERSDFLAVLNNAAIVVVHTRSVDHPEQMGCVSMLTARYFEAYQSGAVVCGFRPTSGEFEKVFNGYPFVEMQNWESFDADLLAELDETKKWENIAEKARIDHSWKARAKTIYRDIQDNWKERRKQKA